MRLLAAAFITVLSAPAFAQGEQLEHTLRSGVRFSGGSFDGLMTGPKVTSGGQKYVGLVPSSPNASPPPPEISAIVDGLVDAYLSHHPERYETYVLPGPILFSHDVESKPQDFIPKGFRFEFTGKLTANTPYYLPDKKDSLAPYNVRVEWLVNGQLEFITWLSVVDDKVIGIISDEAKPPMLPSSLYEAPASGK